MTTTELIVTKTDAVVPVTYSTRCVEVNGVHELHPSRLSLLAYDAACYVAQNSGVRRLVIAGEQSYSHSDESTGDVLNLHTPAHMLDLDLTVLKNADNRLLNTPHQVDALKDEFSSDEVVTVVCWGFHEQRLREGFAAGSQSPVVQFVRVEDVVDHIWNSEDIWDSEHERRTVFRDRYDIQVDWPIIKERGLTQFESREKITRLAMKFGKSGWLLKLLTKVRGAGRYDDINEFAMPIMGSTH